MTLDKHHPAIQVLANMKLHLVRAEKRYKAIEAYRLMTLDEKQDLSLHRMKFRNTLYFALRECPDANAFHLILTIAGPDAVLKIFQQTVENYGDRGLRSA